jgi:hypothetical protein
MNVRKEKEKDFYVTHMDTFRALKNTDPFFIIKTAFFQKGKFGRQIQFFESEIGKGEDIFIEFYDNVTDHNGTITDVIPFYEDRQLFKYKYNPFYTEEYETKSGTNFKGDPYVLYTVPVSELTAVLKDGTEITHALYEKRKAEGTIKPVAIEDQELPRLQSSLFPDFEEETAAPKVDPVITLTSDEDIPLSDMTLRDLAAIMLMKPVSAKPWLNELVTLAKSEI